MDTELTASVVKKRAMELGADVVGIGSIDRWEGAPPQVNPSSIMPRAKSVIGLGFRVHRGSYRGIEEGTYYSGYTLAGFAEINDRHSPVVQRGLASFIEDHGYEALPYTHNSLRLGTEQNRSPKNIVDPGRQAPDIFISFRIAGMLCGLGEIGYSRMLISPVFGPRLRVVYIITEAELEPDPIIHNQLCDRCMECIKKCPGKALTGTDHVDLCGISVKRSGINFKKCSVVHNGGLSPFATEEVREFTRRFINDEIQHDNPSGYIIENTNYSTIADKRFHTPAGLCAGEGCVRACYDHLDKKGLLQNKFKHSFRD